MFTFDPYLGVPIYRQLVEQVRRMTASGQLKPGDELPSVRDLAIAHAVNPMTISKAYGILESEGVLLRQRGKPMQVADSNCNNESETQRVERLLPQLTQLALAAQQLQLKDTVLLDALRVQLEQHPLTVRVNPQDNK
jgi:GntR family transcriptional regulator